MAEILTNNAMFSSFMIVLIVFALGDIVGKITKGKLSGMMVVMLLFLVGFLTKLIRRTSSIREALRRYQNWQLRWYCSTWVLP